MKNGAAMRVGPRVLPWATSLMVLLVISGCGQQPVAEAAAPQAEPAPATNPSGVSTAAAEMETPVVSAPATPIALSEGMTYADLRKQVLENGWQPKVDAQCKANVVGDDFEDVCKDDPSSCKVCDDVPELSSCSADGHCLMNFERGVGEALAVSTYGEIADWNVTGKSSRLFVKWWDPNSIGPPATK